ncbi:MAG: NAD(P)/FAD-dependent oxidoreductase [Bacillota bacterium]
MSADVLIVGAGPGGSAAAILLARAGLAVTVVDRAAFPRDKPCSEYMSPEALRVLDRLGVLADLEAAGAPLEGTIVTASRGARLDGAFARAGHQPFRPAGLSIARRVLDARLVEAARAAGATVLERRTVEDLIYDDGAVGGAVVREADGTRRVIRARLTIGADGLRSVVARRLGGQRYGRPRRIAFVGHFTGVPGVGRSAEMHVGTDGYVGLNAIGDGLTNVALVVPASRARTAAGRPEEFFFDAVGGFPGVGDRVARDSIARRVLVTGPFAASASRVIADGALLLGDAADFFDPFTGEGICSALRGAELAADTVPAALAEPGVVRAARLAPYRTARRRAFAGKWAVERLIGYGMWFPRLFDRAVGRLERRGLADTLIGVTGDFVPARAVLNPWFLARMVL